MELKIVQFGGQEGGSRFCWVGKVFLFRWLPQSLDNFPKNILATEVFGDLQSFCLVCPGIKPLNVPVFEFTLQSSHLFRTNLNICYKVPFELSNTQLSHIVKLPRCSLPVQKACT
jgi:hypothetical protein